MRKLTILLSFLSLVQTAKSQFSLEGIPDSLITGANEILLNELVEFEILDRQNSSLNRNYSVAILDPEQASKNRVRIDYHEFSKIKEAEVAVFDNKGSEISSYKLKDFNDVSLIGYNIASSLRTKYLEVHGNTKPYYVTVSYTIEFNASLHYPFWTAQERKGQSVLDTEFIVKSYDIDKVRFYSPGNHQPEFVSQGENHYLKWRFKNLKAFDWERFSGDISFYTPTVLLAPSDFDVEGLKGNMDSWQELGAWMHRLNAGRNDLDQQEIADLLDKVSEQKSEEAKVRMIYNYLQENTRYVSIQLGIGGWQAFKPSYVHDQKFGDCKALSYYTKTILEMAGIEAHYTLINAGSRNFQRTIPEFPSAHFNHAILTVPSEKDTIWLECTSQSNPFGYMGKFTSDRPALMVGEKGSKIIHTKKYSIEDNKQITRSLIAFDKNGELSLELDRELRGLSVENNSFLRVLNESEKTQKEWIEDRLGLGGLDSLSFRFQEISDEPIPKTGYTIKARIAGAISETGSRLFLKTPVFSKWAGTKLPRTGRKTDIINHYPSQEIDSVVIKIPRGYRLEKGYKIYNLATKFGDLEVQGEDRGDHYIVTRRIRLKKGTYPSSDYAEFRDFLMEIRKSSKTRLVFINKT